MHHIRYNDIGWHVPTSTRDELDLADEPPVDEPGRKFLVDGEAGFYMQAVRIPPNFDAPAHHHDRAELFMVVEGACTFNGEPMVPFDVTVVEPGESYGFIAGSEGVTFLVTRHDIATFVEES
ncbi:MAG: cupin domain-containing protein [Acidimicrobiales bacterium]